MRFDVITLFPDVLEDFISHSILGRALKNSHLEVEFHQLRNWADDSYGTVDDRPFGGGVGMLLRVDVVDRALKAVVNKTPKKNKMFNARVVAVSARGKRLTQIDLERLAKYDQVIVISGHYEGLDSRIEENLVDEVISLGDFVLTGGEIPALALIDGVSRLKSGVLGKNESLSEESFASSLGRKIEYPQYTRPREYLNWKVPEELISGNPKRIEVWKQNWYKKLNRRKKNPTNQKTKE